MDFNASISKLAYMTFIRKTLEKP